MTAVTAENVPAGFVAIALAIGYNAGFGPSYVDAVGGKVGFRVAERHLNPVGLCHGGAIATFADLQVVAAGQYHEGHKPTVSLTIDYVAPAPLGAWVEATVTCIKVTRTLIFTQALITADGKIVARSSAIYRNVAST